MMVEKINYSLRALAVIVLFVLSSSSLYAQEFGLSFSYFLPRNGSFSTPISPFSVRGLGFDINRFVAIETGASLYRMAGLSIIDLPFESNEPLTGPNFTTLVPLQLVLQLRGQRVEFNVKGGGFFFYGFGQRINYGNMDRAIRAYENWTVANSSFTFSNHPGFGYVGGVELTFYPSSLFGISIETNYLMGQSKFPLTGSYTGGISSLETRNVEYADAKIDLTGLEFSIGILFNSNGGGAPRSTKKRRR